MEKEMKSSRTVLARVIILMVVFGVAMFVPLGAQLYAIQITDHDKLEREAIEQQTQSSVIAPGRGTVYDRNMNALAISADVETVCISPKDIKTDEQASMIADHLSRILDVDRQLILDKAAKKDRRREVIRAQIEKPLADEVRQFLTENNVRGMVYLEPDTKRYYPLGTLASTVLGFVGTENKGLMGLEAYYNQSLTGTPGRTVSATDGKGAPLPMQYEMYYDAQDGLDLVLTLDETIQNMVEKHLETAVIENGVANRGSVIVMDVRTGAILAMATKGDFDLNDPRYIEDDAVREALEALMGTDEYANALNDAQQEQWRNKAVSDAYEPGSTFKIFTTAMALEEHAVDPETDRFQCNGSVEIGRWTIRCHKAAGHGSQTFMESLLHSCNPAFISIGQRVGPEKFYSYMKAFGFMEKTGIDMIGETSNASLVSSYEVYSRDVAAQAVYSFGQTFKITPLQLITAVSAIANGGYLMEPYILSKALDGEGRVVESREPRVVRQVISAETSKIMCEYLEQCVISGTGTNAYVKGYQIAGKTGTSQKRDILDADEKGLYVTSFVGFAPADNPQVAVLVMLDEPGLARNLRTGGYMAAPVAGRIFADILPYLGIAPQYSADEAMLVDVSVPLIKGLSVADAQTALRNAGISNFKIEGDGANVTDQMPAAGVKIPASVEIVLYTEGSRPPDSVTVPSVLGMSPEKANAALVNAGLYMRLTGAQPKQGAVLTAAWQEYEGMEVPLGTVVSVEFRDQNVQDGVIAGPVE